MIGDAWCMILHYGWFDGGMAGGMDGWLADGTHKKISEFRLNLPLTSFDHENCGSTAGDHRSTEDWQL